jgi:hypothetical protein
MAVKKSIFFWSVTSCELVDKHQSFGESCCLHFQDVGIYLLVHTLSQSRKTTWKKPILLTDLNTCIYIFKEAARINLRLLEKITYLVC